MRLLRVYEGPYHDSHHSIPVLVLALRYTSLSPHLARNCLRGCCAMSSIVPVCTLAACFRLVIPPRLFVITHGQLVNTICAKLVGPPSMATLTVPVVPSMDG